MNIQNLNDYRLDLKSDDTPKSVVVLLHGYGDSGQGLISLAPLWRDALPAGFQWFSLQEYTPQALLSGAEAAHPVLDNYLDKVLDQTGISADKLALVGFSQGTMMSLYTGPRRIRKLAGILGYSGALVGEDGLKTAAKLPIHLIHGENDSVVPVAAYHQARYAFEENGFEVTGHTTPYLEHSIDERGIQSGQEFLINILN